MSVKERNKKIKKVPPHLVPEIMDFIDFLINKYSKSPKKKKPFKFTWQGGLAEISKKYTSVELQHKAMDWR
ncbi:DUF2281 domain-containing protein [Calditrichota bacterium GD2]